MRWSRKMFAGANFWRSVDTTGIVRARVHETPDGDFYWDVAVVDHGFTIIGQGRDASLALAQAAAQGVFGRESRKRRLHTAA